MVCRDSRPFLDHRIGFRASKATCVTVWASLAVIAHREGRLAFLLQVTHGLPQAASDIVSVCRYLSRLFVPLNTSVESRESIFPTFD